MARGFFALPAFLRGGFEVFRFFVQVCLQFFVGALELLVSRGEVAQQFGALFVELFLLLCEVPRELQVVDGHLAFFQTLHAGPQARQLFAHVRVVLSHARTHGFGVHGSGRAASAPVAAVEQVVGCDLLARRELARRLVVAHAQVALFLQRERLGEQVRGLSGPADGALDRGARDASPAAVSDPALDLFQVLEAFLLVLLDRLAHFLDGALQVSLRFLLDGLDGGLQVLERVVGELYVRVVLEDHPGDGRALCVERFSVWVFQGEPVVDFEALLVLVLVGNLEVEDAEELLVLRDGELEDVVLGQLAVGVGQGLREGHLLTGAYLHGLFAALEHSHGLRALHDQVWVNPRYRSPSPA